MQDKTIIEFQHGDKKAYKAIFNMLYPVMCLFARKFIDDADDAEDVAQEVFIELWKQRVKFESLDQIKAFLYLSIKNRCFNLQKHMHVRERYAQSAFTETESPVEEFIIEAEVVWNLNNAINNLPEQQKQVITLGLQGFKNEEIAENMHISVNTVKLYKKIAYQQLRTKINPSLFLLLFL